jgi:hypothetical protein
MAENQNTEERPTPPPRPPTSQERGDHLLMLWRLRRAAGIPAHNRLEDRA